CPDSGWKGWITVKTSAPSASLGVVVSSFAGSSRGSGPSSQAC
ncbi:MAG: hypothetical protein AVDCRST_MAG93-9150, partial [uncultured Chloroflexia bacterium]